MHIPPRRRRRCLKIHHLSMQGLSQRKIGEQLNVSHATVRADLQLLETHWADIAGAAADDLLLEQLHILREQTVRIARFDIMEAFGEHLTVAEYIKACDDRDAKILAFVREARRTVDAVHRRADRREAQPDLYEDATEVAETAPNPSENNTKPDIPVHPNSASPQPTLEIVPSEAQEETIPPDSAPSDPDPVLDPVIEEALTLFPQLHGKPTDHILAFLDHLTDPNQEQIPIQSAAAG